MMQHQWRSSCSCTNGSSGNGAARRCAAAAPLLRRRRSLPLLRASPQEPSQQANSSSNSAPAETAAQRRARLAAALGALRQENEVLRAAVAAVMAEPTAQRPAAPTTQAGASGSSSSSGDSTLPINKGEVSPPPPPPPPATPSTSTTAAPATPKTADAGAAAAAPNLSATEAATALASAMASAAAAAASVVASTTPSKPPQPPARPSIGPSAAGRAVTEPLAPMVAPMAAPPAGPAPTARRSSTSTSTSSSDQGPGHKPAGPTTSSSDGRRPRAASAGGRPAAPITSPRPPVLDHGAASAAQKTMRSGGAAAALAARGHRVMVVAPRHTNGGADAARYAGAALAATVSGRPVAVELAGGAHELAYYHLRGADGVDWVFVDHPVFQRRGTPYGDADGPFADNLFRFTLLSLAALEAPLQLKIGDGGRPYGDDIVFHANDWHAAMLPVALRARYQPHVYKSAKCALAIHNLAFQGVYPPSDFGGLRLPGPAHGLLEWRPPPGSLPSADGGAAARAAAANGAPTLNVLKGGIVAADAVVTVSPSYAAEIASTPQPQGIERLLAARRGALRGVVNGVDLSAWDPAADAALAANYSADDLAGKAACKRALQRELALPADPRAPLLGFVGRLDYQKGPDIVLDALEALGALGCQVVMLGSGAADYEAAVDAATRAYGWFFRGKVGFDAGLARRIFAGCDAILMPSRFEPCGLNQLYAMRYGAPPIVAATGGLIDTVEDADVLTGGHGTGWTFSPATPEALADAAAAAVACYRGRPRAGAWRRIVERGMRLTDFGWEASADKHERVLAELARPLAAAAAAAAEGRRDASASSAAIAAAV